MELLHACDLGPGQNWGEFTPRPWMPVNGKFLRARRFSRQEHGQPKGVVEAALDELVGQFQPVICGQETHREKITKSQKISLRMQNRGI